MALSLPEAFARRLKLQLGEAFNDFVAALEQKAPVSIRLNPAKPFYNAADLKPVPYLAGGYFLPERPLFTADPLFHAGAYYVQEASSMLVGQTLDDSRSLRLLDLCAAPGGKSTLLQGLISDDSLLVSNETIGSRATILKENLTRWGGLNTVVTNNDPKDFAPLAGFFDYILVDAPCSGEGLWRKEPNAVNEWSPDAVTFCAARQKRILHEAAPLVANGGRLVYATCTFASDENMANAAYFLANFPDFEPIHFDFPTEWGVERLELGGAVGFQCYPHKAGGEGFFIAAFRNKLTASEYEWEPPTGKKPKEVAKDPIKPEVLRRMAASYLCFDENTLAESFDLQLNGQSVFLTPREFSPVVAFLRKNLNVIKAGTLIGELKGKDFIPSHELALSVAVSQNYPSLDLALADAQAFLKKDTFPFSPDLPDGWLLVRYQNAPLGWVKKIGAARLNNYLPSNWRIRMEL